MQESWSEIFHFGPDRRQLWAVEYGLRSPKAIRDIRFPRKAPVAIRIHELKRRKVLPAVIPQRPSEVRLVCRSRHRPEHYLVPIDDPVRASAARECVTSSNIPPNCIQHTVRDLARQAEYYDFRVPEGVVQADRVSKFRLGIEHPYDVPAVSAHVVMNFLLRWMHGIRYSRHSRGEAISAAGSMRAAVTATRSLGRTGATRSLRTRRAIAGLLLLGAVRLALVGAVLSLAATAARHSVLFLPI